MANVTVHAVPDANLSLADGNTVEVGDTVAVYTKRGNCVGYGVWQDTNGMTLAAAGVLTDTASTAGYRSGERLRFEVYDVSANQTVDIAPTDTEYVPCDSTGVPFCGDGTYKNDTFVQLAGFSPAASTERVIATKAGWNLLSVPVQSDDQSFSSLLPSCGEGYFFLPKSGYQAIDSSTTVTPGRGVFSRCQKDTLQVSGTRVQSEVDVRQGWNAIGAFADTISVDSLSTTPADILQSQIYRMTPQGGYQATSALRPGEGYWVRSKDKGTIDLSGQSSAKRGALASKSESQDVARLVISDASGRTTRLLLVRTVTNRQRRLHTLPPVPPRGVFDVRFSDGTSVAAYSTSTTEESTSSARHQVELRGVNFPLTLQLESSDFDRSVRIASNSENIVLSTDDPTAQLSGPSDAFVLETDPRPQGFRLAKVRPNPIQNRGKIEYALPTSSDVSIALFDVLGRRVAHLVDGERQAGKHNAVIPAERLSSGLYFARMRAGSFQQTQRLTVVR